MARLVGLLAGALVVASATPSGAELPPAARASFDKAMIAARQQAWDVAIQNLQEARKAAPNAPEILYNLGLAESKLPGRELRAMAWFGAYLSSQPRAENAAAVRDFIAGLGVKEESEAEQLIRTVQEAALQIPYENDGGFTMRRDEALAEVAGLWASVGNTQAAAAAAALISPKDYMGEHAAAQKDIADGEVERIKRVAEGGDFAGALGDAAAIPDPDESIRARDAIADAQYEYVKAQILANEIAGARSTADAIGQALYRSYAEGAVAEAQARAGDIAAAQQSEAAAAQAAEQASTSDQSSARESVTGARVAIVAAQLAAGDIAGAQRTAEPFVDTNIEDYRSRAEYDICQAQLNAGDILGGRRTAELIGDAQLKFYALGKIAVAQAGTADIAGAQATLLVFRQAADLPENQRLKTEAEETIAGAEKAVAEAQLKAGDAAGARSTVLLAAQAAELIPAGWQRDSSQSEVAGVQAETGDYAGAQRTAESLADASYRRISEVTVAEAQTKAGDLGGARASLVLAGAAAELVNEPTSKVAGLAAVADGLAKIGDVAAARASILLAEQTAQSIGDPYGRAGAEAAIAEASAKAGDVAASRSAILAAQANAALITDPGRRFYVQIGIADVQAEIGDLAGARASILIALDTGEQLTNGWSGRALADAQIKVGDFAGALRSADLIIDNAEARRLALSDIAKAQGRDGATAPRVAASPPRYPPRQPLVSVSAWTDEISALDKPLFLDPAAYLRSLPSDSPQNAFTALRETARTVVDAQGTVDQMLARQAR